MPDRLTFLCFFLMLLPGPVLGQQLNDKMGFKWDFSANGGIGDGSDDAFDGGVILRVNGSNFNGSGQGVNKNGLIVFGPESVGGVMVTRQVLMIDDPAGLVYAESFHNPGKKVVKVTPSVRSDFGSSATPQVKSNSKGRMSAMLYMHRPNRPLIAFHFGEATTEYLVLCRSAKTGNRPIDVLGRRSVSEKRSADQRKENVFVCKPACIRIVRQWEAETHWPGYERFHYNAQKGQGLRQALNSRVPA